jgi:thiamine biosynthesis lipoprotein
MTSAQSGWTHVEHVMGMAVSIDVRGVTPHQMQAEISVGRVVEWLHWVDATFSTYKADSAITRIGAGELQLADADPRVGEVLALADRLRDETEGYFDMRYDGGLDPSGVVKGWAIERASEMLTRSGLEDHAVNAGGDIRLHGSPGGGEAWRVGIAHPLVAGALVAVASVATGAVATSGIAERGAHVIDPHTGRAALDLASVTVIGPDLARADAYATAALAMGDRAPDWLSGVLDHEALVVDAGGATWSTPGFGADNVRPLVPSGRTL